MKRFMYLSMLIPSFTEASIAGMMQRLEDRGQQMKEQGLVTCSLFQLDQWICTYLESEDGSQQLPWEEIAEGWLERWPSPAGPCLAVRMPDIYHDGVPMDRQSWRDGRTIERRVGSLARLKSEYVSSYVFYHYQVQEEKPEHFNKTYTIGLYDGLIFSYAEHPSVVSRVKPQGKLSTSNTPANWHEVMEPHFDHWTDASGERTPWRPMRHLITIE
ncbi:hypothetical protein [Paenibacillus roseipurpureus]|uniref:Uncharacterized protein n=1 Tax=Paenibacillus roseopurpureus TaxID=2918901 RepID=A0AA96LLZ8_9BACL|nr:hypothetical protein [Paenibacillus sp. MBLB1832]WNR43463.1 hypothetical protein MJB10_20480 [Paenibacillus sp. MBLB1832]